MTSKNELKERLRSGAGKKQAIAYDMWLKRINGLMPIPSL